MSTARRGLGPALAVIIAFTVAGGCRGDRFDEGPAGPPAPVVEQAPEPDPGAMERAVEAAVELKLADREAARIGDKGRGDAARLRTAEARLARYEERLDALERKASLSATATKVSDGKPEPEDVGAGKPLPRIEKPLPRPEPPAPDIIEARPEDVAAEPAGADGEPELGFIPAPPPADAADAAEPLLVLTRAAVAPSVDREAREPVDPGTVFDASVGKLYAFMVFQNSTEDEHRVTVIWKRNGKELSRLPDLKVGPKASRWRTWAYVTINERRRGDWAVEIEGPDDALLGTVRFRIE